MTIFLLLIFGHFLADFPLQGDYLAKFKNKALNDGHVPWWYIMAVHAGIHAGFVGIITQSVFLAMLEFFAHFFIDTVKCKGKISYMIDQVLHVYCKLLWSGIYVYINL